MSHPKGRGRPPKREPLDAVVGLIAGDLWGATSALANSLGMFPGVLGHVGLRVSRDLSFRGPLGMGGGAMRTTRIGLGRQTLVLATLVSLWLTLTGLLLVARGNPEAFLLRNLGHYSRADAFEHLNSGLPFFWFAHSTLVLMAIEAARFRRTDMLMVLLIGPAIALVFNLFYQEWSDPNWYVLVAVGTIGWLVSTIVGGVYWSLRPTA